MITYAEKIKEMRKDLDFEITNNKEIDLTSPYLVEKALKLEKEISSKQ